MEPAVAEVVRRFFEEEYGNEDSEQTLVRTLNTGFTLLRLLVLLS